MQRHFYHLAPLFKTVLSDDKNSTLPSLALISRGRPFQLTAMFISFSSVFDTFGYLLVEKNHFLNINVV